LRFALPEPPPTFGRSTFMLARKTMSATMRASTPRTSNPTTAATGTATSKVAGFVTYGRAITTLPAA
jgi:hypothetical protein